MSAGNFTMNMSYQYALIDELQEYQTMIMEIWEAGFDDDETDGLSQEEIELELMILTLKSKIIPELLNDEYSDDAEYDY